MHAVDNESIADSGNVMRRRFCSMCGTPVFSEALARPDVIVVRAGTLDDPDLPQFEDHVPAVPR